MNWKLPTTWQAWLGAILVIGAITTSPRANAVVFADDEACCLNLPAPPASEADGLLTTRFKDIAGNGSTPEQSLFTLDIQPAGGLNASPVPPVPAGRYAAWCFDAVTEINPQPTGTLYGGYLLPTCDPLRDINQFLPDHPNVKVDAATWKKVNYLINRRTQPCNGVVPRMWEVQRVIYSLFNQTAPTNGYPNFRTSVEQCLLADVEANAANWTPKCGDKIATIFNIDVNWDNVNPEVQLIFIEVPCPCTSLGNYVWVDANQNGIQDEPATAGLNGVIVNLLDCSGAPVRDAADGPLSTITANDSFGNPGYYLFKNLVAGCYRVEFLLPSGYVFTTRNSALSTTENDSDADPNTGVTGNISLGYGAQDLTWDAGLVQTAEIGDRVFNDTNANGQQDGGELGVDGVTVELFRCADNALVDSMVTTDGGLYGFTVPPGDYYVKFSNLPSGFVFSPSTASAASDATDSDANPTTGVTDCTTLVAGENDPTWDAGIYQPAKIGDLVFNDTNANGQQDGGELGVDGVTVELFRCADNTLVSSTLTVGGGLYSFTVPPGDYYVKFSNLPSGFVFSPSTASAASDATDSDANPATGVADCTTLVAGENDPTWDAGIYQPAKIGDLVFNDTNANGQQDGGELGVDGVTVELFRCADNTLVSSTLTVGGGLYSFTVPPGDYYVKFSNLPSGFVFSPSTASAASDATDSDANPTTGVTDCTTLVAGENDPTWDAGIYQPAKIGDLVFNDTNANGQQDGGELGVDGVTVELFKCSDNTLVKSAVTAGGGLYWFTVPPGDYYVKFSNLPSGYVFSPSTASAASDATDSDANPATGVADCTTLVAGENDPTWDAGIYQPAKIGDLVFNDTNANGQQDGGELGVDGVTVELLKCADNTLVKSAVTTGGGLYSFTVPPGDYYVKFSNLPSGFVFSPSTASAASDATDSDANPATGVADCTTLVAGENDTTWDAGIYQPETHECVSSSFAFLGSSASYGTAGNIRTYMTTNGVSMKASAFSRNKTTGAWSPAFLGVFPGGLGVTDGTEGNGSGNAHTIDNIGEQNYVLFEFSEPVNVSSASLGYVVTDSDFTAWIGNFSDPFNNHLSLSDAILAGFGAPEENLIDNGGVPRTASINAGGVVGNALIIAALVSDTSPEDQFKIAGLGICSPSGGQSLASIGDRVWNDLNKNGQQDAGEPGVDGVKVELFRCADNTLAGTTATTGGGLYGFTVPAGDYYVKFGNLPAGFVLTSSVAGSASDSNDSDANAVTGKTDCTTLAAGENDASWDAGIYQQCAASICGFVLRDCNADGYLAGEQGLSGWTVNLKNSTGTIVASMITGTDGSYCFNGLAAATYKVVVVPQANYKPTTDLDGTCDHLTAITLGSCQAKAGVNFGYTGTTASVSLTKTGPSTAKCGDTVTFTYVVKNTGNTCLYGGMGIDDPLFGGQIFHKTPVYPGESFTVTKTYVVTTANAGTFTSSATAFGHPPGTLPAVYAPASWTINVACQKPTCYPVTSGSCQNYVSWTPCAGATSYKVKRCSTPDGVYTDVCTVSSTSCTDFGLNNGTHYYYKVCAVVSGSTTPDSDTVCGVPTAGLPSPWSTKDVGAVAAAGSATYTSGTFTVNGSGDDIWNGADDYRYVYQLASGDCSVVAKVTGVENSNGWSKAGVMIRETLNSASKHASVFVTPSNGVAFQYRNTTGGTSANANTAGLTAPYWVKIVRSGSTFTAYRSADGWSWNYVGSTSITMGSSVYIGLAVTSHNDGDLCTAKFTNVTATP